MAPEQLLRGGPGDARSDQFSFCVALYEGLYGERPFVASSLAELTLAIAEGQVGAPPADRAVPAWLRAILLRGLSARPEDRFPSMEALLAALLHDPEADPRVSDRARAFAVAAFGVFYIVGSVLYQRRYHEGPVPREVRMRDVTLGSLVTVAIGLLVAFFGRKSLFTNRASRQLLAALGVIFYTSVLQGFVALRMGLPPERIGLVNGFWGAAGILVMGITLQRLFLWIGGVAFGLSLLGLAFPSHAWAAMTALQLICTFGLVAAWIRRKPT
jgi:hypothetical protein